MKHRPKPNFSVLWGRGILECVFRGHSKNKTLNSLMVDVSELWLVPKKNGNFCDTNNIGVSFFTTGIVLGVRLPLPLA